MDSAILSLLGAFLLSIMGLFVFIWSMRKGLLVEHPRAAGTICAPDEVGKADDPSLTKSGEQLLQRAHRSLPPVMGIASCSKHKPKHH